MSAPEKTGRTQSGWPALIEKKFIKPPPASESKLARLADGKFF
jgi:hypothetical protein